MSDFWTDERVERLRHLKRDKWSAGMIARDLGTTRNAVIGKMDRLRGTPSTPRAPIDWNLRRIVILDVQANKLPAHVAGLRLGLSADQTRRYAKRLGIPFAAINGDMRGQRATVSVPRAPKDRKSIKGVRQAPLRPTVDPEIAAYEAERRASGALPFIEAPSMGRCKMFLAGESGIHGLQCAAPIGVMQSWCSEHNAVVSVPVPGRQQIYAGRR